MSADGRRFVSVSYSDVKASSHKTNQWGEAGGNIDKSFQAPEKKITLFLIDFETPRLKFLMRGWKVLCDEASCSEIFPAPSLSLTSFISLAGKELMVVQAPNFILALNSSSWASPPWIALQLPFRSIYSFNLHNIPYRRELPCLIVCRRRTWFQAFQPVIFIWHPQLPNYKEQQSFSFHLLQASPPPVHKHYFASKPAFNVLHYYYITV